VGACGGVPWYLLETFLVLYVWSRRGLVMLCLVTTVVGQQRWLGSLPCRSARRGLGRSPRVADLLDRDLVGKWARERFMGLALGTPFWVPDKSPRAFVRLLGVGWRLSCRGSKSPMCMEVHQYDIAPEPPNNP
jgi:hypothetical protein